MSDGHKGDTDTHFILWGAVQVVEEDGTPPVHPVDALPDTHASPSLLFTFILEQQAWQKNRAAAVAYFCTLCQSKLKSQ